MPYCIVAFVECGMQCLGYFTGISEIRNAVFLSFVRRSVN